MAAEPRLLATPLLPPPSLPSGGGGGVAERRRLSLAARPARPRLPRARIGRPVEVGRGGGRGRGAGTFNGVAARAERGVT